MTVAAAALCGFVIDLLLGDPAWMPHPVVCMGRCISALEKLLRRIFPKTPKGELAGGVILAAVLPLGTLVFTGLCVWGLGLVHPALSFALQVLWCWQALAAKGLRQESENVRRALVTGTLDDARKAVSRIVGRDTAALSREGVIRAAVETVAENFSDGVVAPLFWMLLGGAPLALAYKAVNTMDSMVGYKNDRCCQLAAVPAGGASAGGGGSPHRTERRKGFCYLAPGPPQTRQPQLRPDRIRHGGGAGGAAGGACQLFRQDSPKALDRGRHPAH